MKTLYHDCTACSDCMGVFVRDALVNPAGTTVNAMSDRHRNAEYDRYAREYDIRFLFESDCLQVDFYAVPQFDMFARDSLGGFLGSLGGAADTHSEYPIYYIDGARKVFRVADGLRQLILHPEHWRAQMKPSEDIRFFPSREDAEAVLEFIDPGKIP